MTTRRQLSLHVPEPMLAMIDAVRTVVDPVQRALIPAHVTLCREDEIATLDLATLTQRLSAAKAITLAFDEAEVFHEHGLWLPCIGGLSDYQALRSLALGTTAIRQPQPHITLAHPRNPRAPGNTLAAARRLPMPIGIRFDRVSLIEQHHDGPWRELGSVMLI